MSARHSTSRRAPNSTPNTKSTCVDKSALRTGSGPDCVAPAVTVIRRVGAVECQHGGTDPSRLGAQGGRYDFRELPVPTGEHVLLEAFPGRHEDEITRNHETTTHDDELEVEQRDE